MTLCSSMDLFECPVCLSDMVDRSPRSLSCLHTFCSECLDHLINNRQIECPTCMEITEVKTNYVQELKVNFMLGQLRDREQKQAQASNKETKSSPGPCVKCVSKHQLYLNVKTAPSYCVEHEGKHIKISRNLKIILFLIYVRKNSKESPIYVNNVYVHFD